jgi:hypothetical protein
LRERCPGSTALIFSHPGNERGGVDVMLGTRWIDQGFSEVYGNLPGTRPGA